MKNLIMTAFVLLASTLHTSAGENRFIKINNRSEGIIRYIYAANVDSDVWGYDLLGAGNVIFPDRYMTVNIDDGTGHCHYNIKAVLWDRSEALWRDINVCTASNITLTN